MKIIWRENIINTENCNEAMTCYIVLGPSEWKLYNVENRNNCDMSFTLVADSKDRFLLTLSGIDSRTNVK